MRDRLGLVYSLVDYDQSNDIDKAEFTELLNTYRKTAYAFGTGPNPALYKGKDAELELMWSSLTTGEEGNPIIVDRRQFVNAVAVLTKRMDKVARHQSLFSLPFVAFPRCMSLFLKAVAIQGSPEWAWAAAHWHMRGVPYNLADPDSQVSGKSCNAGALLTCLSMRYHSIVAAFRGFKAPLLSLPYSLLSASTARFAACSCG